MVKVLEDRSTTVVEEVVAGEDERKPGLRPLIGLVLGPALFLLLLLVPPPTDMPVSAWRTAAVGALMAIWWITEAIPIPATALLPIVLLPLLGVTQITGAASPYANSVIFLFLGGFIIAAGLQKCGLHRRMALGIIGLVGTSPVRLVGGFMLATGFLSMWVSNTATAVMMLPMALSVLALVEGAGERDDNLAIALLLGIAYSASIGGLGTLIGTPPNALLAGFMEEAYGIRIGFMQWMLLGVPLVMIALPTAWLLLTRVLYPVKSSDSAAGREVIDREKRALGQASRAEWMVGIVTGLTAACWVIQPLLEPLVPGLSDAGIGVAGALLLFLVPLNLRRGDFLLSWKDAESLPWGVLILFGGGLSLASAIQQTGLADWIGGSLAGIGAWPLVAIVVIVTAIVLGLTELTSNTATAAGFLPVVASLATGIGADPLTLAIPAALAAASAFMLPVATPPNAIVYASGRITIAQMARAGVVLNIFFIILIAVVVFTMVDPIFH